ncbi:serine/arginine repetitive matrix protein 1-like [Canis lupus familiaris]|uniref:serine/arginine repetitive matrix protein 1-like n=1 Tax=Canis lupus familiaris TaxID=9615 RepID=UPI000BA9FF38|nr:serine/arginine repetitive matrix protein 1-like [Canis lupus familiaris]XP_022263196.1 serine/arginine repetitive matrix protein 1-like [Canis lupus familiaris]XP_022263197.1 serine/arginine repetitive matrix protein 1-like [Canis lupus familiaris]XP_022263198.1 serine/arginine repetitive matrix protein 1-like [Canis lupus familiaris]XP_022263199.1 serine/arginine repetitive matrix protein 1-like [Canis lupus familiaris]XP_038285650.1 serine/arginine repetitive matrix protein 1-like [Canis|eukprot:XP_022263194.1 serine/arginine repetitive matrix protein 1-like [Canis lupus familiaris]
MRGLRPSPRSLSGQTDQPEETELGTRAQGTGRWRCSSMLLWKGFDLVPRILCEGEDPRQPNAEGIRPAQRRPRRPRRPPPLPEVPAGLRGPRARGGQRRLATASASANSWRRAAPPFLRPPAATSRLPRTSVRTRRKATPGAPSSGHPRKQ